MTSIRKSNRSNHLKSYLKRVKRIVKILKQPIATLFILMFGICSINAQNTETSLKLIEVKVQEKEIFGEITTTDIPLKDVNIRVIGTTKGTTTDRNGKYKLKVKVGDEVQYSYVGLHKVSVIIEDITSEVNIDMVSLQNNLDEVLIIAKNTKGAVIKRNEKANKKFESTRGNIDPAKAGFAVGFIDGQKVNFAMYQSISEAIQGKISGITVDNVTGKVYLRGQGSSINQDYPAAWEVDGNFTTEEPIGINLNEIQEIYLLRGPSATNKYGTLGAGGVIIVKTTMSDLSGDKKLQGIKQEYTNQNYYQNDAISLDAVNTTGLHIDAIKEYSNRFLAYQFYENELSAKLNKYDQHIDVALVFSDYFNDNYRAGELLFNLARKNSKNPEILKAIAFNLQSLNLNRQAVSVYRQILGLRPSYGQSYRDLANAHKENNQFQESWKYYMKYLLQGNTLEGEGLGQLIYNEMEYLYFNRANQTKIQQKFTPRSEDKVAFRSDVRFVVEWNTSEAEFDLEFVSPDKRAYTFEHTLVGNQDLITDEKKTGYSSKEFIIDDVGEGEWLMNLVYYGNKKSVPTYMKLTTYYNWGKPEQTQKTEVFKLYQEDLKFQILDINRKNLVVEK